MPPLVVTEAGRVVVVVAVAVVVVVQSICFLVLLISVTAKKGAEKVTG